MQGGWLPLHYAAKNCASPLVIRRLLEAYPKGAAVLSFSQRLPLHWACESRLEPESLKLLIDAYPAGLSMQDAYGYLPKELAATGVQSLLQ